MLCLRNGRGTLAYRSCRVIISWFELNPKSLGIRCLVLFACFTWLPMATWAENLSPEEWVDKAQGAAGRGDLAMALKYLDKAVDAAPDDTSHRLRRATVRDRIRQHTNAIQDCDEVLRQNPENAFAIQLRGGAKFKSGDVKGSIQDFDRVIKLDPRREPSHWQRGISYYYARQYVQGARQFELYQTYDGGDVENVVWRFLCQARTEGVAAARKDILVLESADPRIPMKEVYGLFQGKLTIEDVLKAAQRGNPDESTLNRQLFYAHLYVGLYCEATEQPKLAVYHLREAERHPISHYMWDVAHVHVQQLSSP